MRSTKFLQHPLFVVFLLCLFSSIFNSAHAALTTFSYDESGRLSGMNDSGGAAEFTYDNQGNLLSVQRNAVGAPMILEFTPNRGPVGTQVNITGRGFSATASSNIVKFNGVVANVVSAGTTSLVVQVPSGATTGKISVTVGTLTDTSTQDFEVAAVAGLPTITSFTPTIGGPDTTVTITGTNFATTHGDTRVEFNQSVATITAISATSITVMAPKNVLNGPIRVITPAGQTTSSAYFVVPPSDISASNIVAQKQLSIGGVAQVLTITPAGKVGTYYFDGTTNQYLTLNIASLTTNPVANVPYRLYNTQNQQILSGSVSTSNPFIHFPALLQNGRYYLYFLPSTSTATINASLSADAVISPDSGSVPLSTSTAGQSRRFYLSANAGDYIDLALTGLTHGPTNDGSANIYIDAPNGSVLASTSCVPNTSNCVVHAYVSQSGVYVVRVVAPTNRTLSATLWASKSVASTLSNGTTLTTAITRAGKSGVFTFTGTLGQTTGLILSSLVTNPADQAMMVEVYRTDTHEKINSRTTSLGSLSMDLEKMPMSGKYIVVVAPTTTATANFQLLLKFAPMVMFDSTALPISNSTAGTSLSYQFNATAGQSFTVALSDVTYTSTGDPVILYIEDPSGVHGYGGDCLNTGCNTSIINAPTSGVYTIKLINNRTFTAKLWLNTSLKPALADNTPLNVSLTRPGQNALFTIKGSASSGIRVQLSNANTNPTPSAFLIRLYRSDSMHLMTEKATSASLGTGQIYLTSLPYTGDYLVEVIGADVTTGSFTITNIPQ